MKRHLLYMTPQERRALNNLVTNYPRGPSNFSEDYGAAWSGRRYTNRDVAVSQIPAWISGRTKFLSLRGAEVFLDVLGDRPELGFLRRFVDSARNKEPKSPEER